MEMSHSRLHIVAGTLERLILRLADENTQDMAYVDTFLRNHALIITCEELIESLISRFAIEPPPDGKAEDFDYFYKWKHPIQQKVIQVIYRWTTLQVELFKEGSSMANLLEDFFEQAISEGFQHDVNLIRENIRKQFIKLEESFENAPFLADIAGRQSLGPSPFPSINEPPKLNDNSPLLRLNAQDIAKYLTMADYQAYLSISSLDYALSFERKAEEFPENIKMYTQRSNMVYKLYIFKKKRFDPCHSFCLHRQFSINF